MMMSYFTGGIVTGIFISVMIAFVIWAIIDTKASRALQAEADAQIANIAKLRKQYEDAGLIKPRAEVAR